MDDPESEFDFLAAHPALDFANTVANRLDTASARELLAVPGDLQRWLAGAGLGSETRLSTSDLPEALRMREQLYRLFVAAAREEPLDAAALRALDDARRAAHSLRELALVDGRVTTRWSPAAKALERAMLPVLDAAADLLQSDDIARVRQCEGAGCGWLFLDRSRGRPRRWCSMQDCGNRAKARRHYLKRQQDGMKGCS